jgi:transcriptional regulator with PAS, ATPase and Fis domain
MELQAKLLRFLQEREFTRVGGNRTIKVDVRIIAATNTNLNDMIREERFRNDLYFRLNVIPIEIPPLRRRKGDIPLLANYFLYKFNRQLNKRIKEITNDVMDVLEAYPWPGNIRELENFIERMVVLGSDDRLIEEKDLPFDLLFHGELIE